VWLLLHAKHGIDRSIYASLVEDSKNIMRMLRNVCLVKINREKNKVAHELAQHANMLDKLSALRFG